MDGISPSLRPSDLDLGAAIRLHQNHGFAFQGPIPVGDGFVIDESEADVLLSRSDAEYAAVVRPYLTSQDIAVDPRQKPRRWVIDFGTMPLDVASEFSAAMQIVRDRVKPFRDQNSDIGFRERWWLFGRPRGKMREAVSKIDRYVASTRHGVRLHFCWCELPTMASDATNIFAFEDDFSMGVLCSEAHARWAWAQSSTIRQDIRYTPGSAFETFPWPDPTGKQREAVAEACRTVFALRERLCLERDLGLTALYNEVDEGMHVELKELHRELDRAVVAAYGWPASAAEDADESNRRLLELNKAITAGEIEYAGPAVERRERGEESGG